MLAIGLGVAVVVVAALVLAATMTNAGSKPSANVPAVVAAVTGVPATALATVGAGSATAAPKAVSETTPSTGAKPEILYIGAEYCPYCAAERWALVVALSRFGTFSGLGLTHSSTVDVYPDTATLSFYGSSFSSPYLRLETVETTTNQIGSDGNYQTLQTPTAAQQATWLSLDPQESIPFVDIGARYIVEGATFDPRVLQGKTASQIATDLANPSSPVAQAVLGAANGITAAICQVTGNQPGSACTAN
jgi:hypothetical protein